MMISSLNVGLLRMMEEVRLQTVESCALKYGFNSEDALSSLGGLLLSEGTKKSTKKEGKGKTEKREKPSVPLPFKGSIQEGCCSGLKQNHGLLTQCQNGSDSEYCKGCQKQCDKNASGKPDCGSVSDRMAAYMSGLEFRDPKGRAPIAYAKVVQKLKLTREQVEAEAAKFNVVLEESDFAMPESKRGRPKKAVSDTDSEVSSEPKKRGRPKKTEKPVEVSSTEDLFASLISEVKAASPRPEPKAEAAPLSKKEQKEAEKKAAKDKKEAEKQAAKAKKEADKAAKKETKPVKKAEPVPVPAPVEEEEEEEVVLSVKKFVFQGKTYLRTADNVLYDAETQDEVGVFNEAQQKIEECELESESEEEDDEDEE
jgi:hypothetical protein